MTGSHSHQCGSALVFGHFYVALDPTGLRESPKPSSDCAALMKPSVSKRSPVHLLWALENSRCNSCDLFAMALAECVSELGIPSFHLHRSVPATL